MPLSISSAHIVRAERVLMDKFLSLDTEQTYLAMCARLGLDRLRYWKHALLDARNWATCTREELDRHFEACRILARAVATNRNLPRGPVWFAMRFAPTETFNNGELLLEFTTNSEFLSVIERPRDLGLVLVVLATITPHIRPREGGSHALPADIPHNMVEAVINSVMHDSVEVERASSRARKHGFPILTPELQMFTGGVPNGALERLAQNTEIRHMLRDPSPVEERRNRKKALAFVTRSNTLNGGTGGACDAGLPVRIGDLTWVGRLDEDLRRIPGTGIYTTTWRLQSPGGRRRERTVELRNTGGDEFVICFRGATYNEFHRLHRRSFSATPLRFHISSFSKPEEVTPRE